MTAVNPPIDLVARVHARSPLEIEARELIDQRSGARRAVLNDGDGAVFGMVEREIAVALEELGSLRGLHEDLDRDLVRSECRIRTDLHGLRPLPYGPDDKSGVRYALKRRLEELARERRGIAAELHVQRRQQLERLATLMERHRQLRGDDDGR
ncbi:MAG: hypothetical protein IT436_15950 [Phycisphaerales bacterium]|nr:hypothetical protein [Phycisphaerales bacterium]